MASRNLLKNLQDSYIRTVVRTIKTTLETLRVVLCSPFWIRLFQTHDIQIKVLGWVQTHQTGLEFFHKRPFTLKQDKTFGKNNKINRTRWLKFLRFRYEGRPEKIPEFLCHHVDNSWDFTSQFLKKNIDGLICKIK